MKALPLGAATLALALASAALARNEKIGEDGTGPTMDEDAAGWDRPGGDAWA